VIRWALVACLVSEGCAGGVRPAEIALGSDACAYCRMTILSLKTAAQIIRPGVEPLLFDDLGCLRDHVAVARLADDAMVFVADHRTGTWVDGLSAVFTQTGEQTPMGSGLLAHDGTVSRDSDPAAGRGAPVSASTMLGSAATRRSR
jgi:copper chaperone NosL